jgi:TonB family protein
MMRRALRRGRRALVAVCVFTAWSAHAETRLSPREQADPLEPWSMEFVPGAGNPGASPAPAANPASLDTAESGSAPNPAAPPQSPLVPDDSDPGAVARAQAAKEQVLVVRCRQLLIGQPAAAERLGELLRGGASFEAARRAVGSIDLTDRTRDYALDELEPDLQREVEALPAGGWSRTRPWNGRTALFQVVDKQTRERGTIPALGAGLSPDEQARLARVQRDRPAPAAVAAANAASAETRDLDPAAVVQQVQPTPPENVTIGGTVTVVVQIGRTDDVTDVQVESSSDALFNAPALDAARRSTYRSANRNGIPEPGSVRITFNFPVPQHD